VIPLALGVNFRGSRYRRLGIFPWNWGGHGPVAGWKTESRRRKSRKIFPFQNLGSEFMPPLYEGDLLYMPTTSGHFRPTKAREIIQITDKNHPRVS